MLKDISILVAEPGNTESNPLIGFFRENTQARVLHAKNTTEALELIRKNSRLELLFTDLFFPDLSGLELIRNAVGINPCLVPIVILPSGSRNYIADSMHAGALFYLTTPYESGEILEITKNALNYNKLLHLSNEKPQRVRKSDGFAGIIGESPPMKELFRTIERVAAIGDGNVLINGESGTGKELVAKAIHELSPDRSSYNFVPVNCAAIPEELLESELFGYEKGAFTGANRAKKGRLQHADKGTLFLDEIGDMKPGLQGKLLRVLQEQSFEPVGSVKTLEVDIRVVAATNRDLEQKVREGSFRDDLYYRLSVVPVNIPPLRDRTEDIPLLIEKFLLMYNRGRKNEPLEFTERAMERLMSYDWPGNVRELQNLVQRMCILHTGEKVGEESLPKTFRENEPAAEEPGQENPGRIEEPMDFHAMTTEYENHLILKALYTTNWNKKEAARLLKMKRTTLLEKIKKRSLDQRKEN